MLRLFVTTLLFIHIPTTNANSFGEYEYRTVEVIRFYPTQNQVPPARWRAVIKDTTNGTVVKTPILCKWFRGRRVSDGAFVKVKYNISKMKYVIGCSNFIKRGE